MNDWFGDFFYQLISIFLFAIALVAVAYFLTEKKQTGFLISAFFAWIFIGAAICVYLNSKILIEPETEGILIPAQVPSPPIPTSCTIPVPNDALLVYVSNSLAWFTGDICTIVRVAGENLLSIGRKENRISINARIYSQDKKIVAEIKDSRFQINPNNYFRRERPNKHSLIVYDQEGKEVLNIDYLNPNAVKITGTFFYPRRAPVVISADSISASGLTFTRTCFGKTMTVLDIQ